MLSSFTYSFFLQKIASRLIFSLHFTLKSILSSMLSLVFYIFLLLLKFIVKVSIPFKFLCISDKKWVFDHTGKGESFFPIHNKDLFKKIFNIRINFFKFLFFLNHRLNIEGRVASAINISF